MDATSRRDIPLGTIAVWTVLIALLIAAYLVYLHSGHAQLLLRTVRHSGLTGVAIGVGLMTVFSIIPVPGEFVSIFLLQTYGVGWGIALSWLGSLLGAVLALYATRGLARPFVTRKTQRYLLQIEPWLLQRGAIGLLVVRLLPMVPYHLVNYVSGILRVPFLPFLWTTAVGILPFQLALAAVYSGLRYGSVVTGVIGGVVLLTMVLLGWRFRRHLLPSRDPS